jgi:Beta-lactamase enzyme family
LVLAAVREAINSNNLKLSDKIAIRSDLVAEGDDSFSPNQLKTVEQLIREVAKSSSNTGANVLIDKLGINAINSSNKGKSPNSSIGSYYNNPSAKAGGGKNVSTAADLNKIIIDLYKGTDPVSRIIQDSLNNTDHKFGYKGEVGGKIGNTSKVVGNVGIIEIKGKKYALTQFYETADSPAAREKLRQNTNSISANLSSEQKSTPQAPTPKAKSKPKPKAILNPRTNPETTGLEPSAQRAIDKTTTDLLRAEQRLAQLREKGAKIELITKAEERVDDLKLKLDQTVSKAKKRRPSAPIINQNTPAPEGVDPAVQKQINSTEPAIKRKEKELERLISSDAKEERISKVQEQIADKKDKLAELKIKAKKRKPSSRSPVLAIDKAAPEGVDQAVQDQINVTETRIKREEAELKQLIESGAKSDRITKLKEKISDDQGKLKKLKQKRKVPKVLPTVTAEIDSTATPNPAQPSKASGALAEAIEKERRALEDIEDIEYDGVKKSESAYRDRLKRAQRRYADARKLVEKIKGKSSDPKVQAEIDLTKIKSEIDPILSKTSLLNLSTDQAVARDPKLAAVGEKTKAARLVGQSQALAKFLPEIARLRTKYQDNPETIIKIDAIEATIRSSDKDATSATSVVGKAATAKRLEDVKGNVEKITRDRDRAIEAARNNALKDPNVTKENLDQAILSLQIKYNAELQKQIPLIKAAKAAASDRSDIKAYEDLADAIARTNAETISANRGDSFATIKSSIDKQISSSTNRSEEIAVNGQSRIAGEVDIAKIQQIQLETQQRQVANQELYNAEIQKTKEQLDYLRSQAKGDEIAPIEEYQRKISKIDADTKTAASEYLKADTLAQFEAIKKRITAITRVGNKRQSIVKDDAILNPPAEVKNSFLDPTIAIEKQNAEALLSIRQQTTKELLAQIPILEALRALQGNDPAATERINEELAGIRAYQIETINATRAKKEADLAASVVGQTTQQLNVEMGSSFKAMFLDIANGGKNINSIFDNLLNKIANIGLSGIFDSLFGNISGGGKSGGILDGLGKTIGKIFGFKDGGPISDAPPIPNFKAGGGIGAAFGLAASVSEAFRKEGAGSKGRLIVANTDERVLNPQQTSIFNGMLSDGTWQQFERMYVGNHSNGGMVGAANQSTQVRSNPVSSDRSGGRQGVVVDRINSVDYVTLEQVMSITDVKMSNAAKAGSQLSTQNLSNSAFRQQNGIR